MKIRNTGVIGGVPHCHTGFSDLIAAVRHMSAVHPPVDETLVQTLIMAASPQHKLARASDCPFCTDSCMWPHLRRQDLTALRDDQKLDNTLVPLGLYQRHLSHHMEQLALFAVPSVASDIHNKRS